MRPQHGGRGAEGAGVGRRADLAAPDHPDPRAPAPTCSAAWLALAGHPDIQRLRLQRPEARPAAFRLPVRKSDGNTESRDSIIHTCAGQRPGQTTGTCACPIRRSCRSKRPHRTSRRQLGRSLQFQRRSRHDGQAVASSRAAGESTCQGDAAMPMNSSQLAALVERARKTPPPVLSPPPRSVQPRLVKPVPQAPSTARPAPAMEAPAISPPPAPSAPSPPPNQSALPRAEVSPSDDFPIGWQLRKESWHFHRRFHRVLRRPMHRGEYSYLLHQIRGGHAEHLGENYWRVTLPDRRRTLMICATEWAVDHHPTEGLAAYSQKQECAEDA